MTEIWILYALIKDPGNVCSRNHLMEAANTFIDENTVTFVAIHELAHVMSVSNGHTPEFWKNMKYLLERGSEIGIYTPIDYAKNPVMFCGMEINSTPYDFGGPKTEYKYSQVV